MDSMGEDVDSGEKIDREPHYGRSQKRKVQSASQPVQGRAVCSPFFLRQVRGQSLVHDSCNGAHTSCG